MFSGSFLLALTVFELLPEVYSEPNPKLIGLFILLGMLLQIFLEYYSQGLEHGHKPHRSNNPSTQAAIFASLCLHALLEGIPVESHEHIVAGIVIHKIPVAIILSLLLVNSGMKKTKALAIVVIFSLMTPIGGYLAHHLEFLQLYQPYLMAMIIGVFLHISTVILLESSEGHRFNTQKVIVILLGIVLAYFI